MNPARSDQIIVSIVFVNQTDKHIKDLEFNVLDTLNTKLVRGVSQIFVLSSRNTQVAHIDASFRASTVLVDPQLTGQSFGDQFVFVSKKFIYPEFQMCPEK